MHFKLTDTCMVCSQEPYVYLVKKLASTPDILLLGFCKDHGFIQFAGLKAVFEDEDSISFEELKKLYV